VASAPARAVTPGEVADRVLDVAAPGADRWVEVPGVVVLPARIVTCRERTPVTKHIWEDKKMPRGDGTGPAGMGPMTGRAAGYCAGYGAPGFASSAWGRGYGFGRGLGRGFAPGWGRGGGRGFGRGFGWRAWGRPYWGAPAYPGAVSASSPATGPWNNPWSATEISREEELDYLRDQAAALKGELDAISQRVTELESEPQTGGSR